MNSKIKMNYFLFCFSFSDSSLRCVTCQHDFSCLIGFSVDLNTNVLCNCLMPTSTTSTTSTTTSFIISTPKATGFALLFFLFYLFP